MIEETVVLEETVQPITESVEPPAEQNQEAPINQEQDRIEKLREERRKRPREQAYSNQSVPEKNQQQQPFSAEEELHLADDDLAEGKHIKRYAQKIKVLEEKLKAYEQTTQATTAEVRLRNTFPDFDKVVNTENVELLRDLEPDLAASINANQDLYTKASSAYKLIKKLGIYQEDSFKHEREHAQLNVNKPRPLASVSPQQGESPLQRANAFANGLTDELKAQLLKEMREVRRRN